MNAPKPQVSAEAIARAIAETREIVRQDWAGKLPGASVAVALGDDVVWSEAFGLADVEKQIPTSTTTRFRVASVAKPFTSAGLALLVERGALDLDAPVQKYIPDFPDKGAVITPRMLAGHLSGIRGYKDGEIFAANQYPNLRAGLKIFEHDPLLHPPGSKYLYCSYGWNVLGVAMEAAAKQDFVTYMRENVFTPLGLANTVPDMAGAADPQRAQFYEVDRTGKFAIAPLVNNSEKWPSGGYLSTAEDMVRFGARMIPPGFLKVESLRLLYTSQKTTDGTYTNYGLGWQVTKPANGPLVLSHSGSIIGGLSHLVMLPAYRLVLGLAGNRGGVMLDRALSKGMIDAELGRSLTVSPDVGIKAIATFAKALIRKV